MADEFYTDILKREWELTSANIGRYDPIFITIRSWCVTLVTAVCGFSISETQPVFLLLSVLPIMMFWLLDGLYKVYQRRHIIRLRDIEAQISKHLKQEEEASATVYDGPQVGKKTEILILSIALTSLPRAMCAAPMLAFYLPMLVFVSLMYLYFPFAMLSNIKV